MKVAICDDNGITMSKTENILLNYHPTLFEIELFEEPIHLIEACKNSYYDFFILDIEMPKMNGIQLAEQIRAMNNYNPIIFLTSYKQYMEKVFKVQTFDYLLKPIEQVEMDKVLDRLSNYLQITDQRFIFSFNKVTHSLLFSDIIYFEKYKRAVKIYTKNEQFQTLMTTEELLKKLPNDFIQIHHSFVINIKYFKTLSGETIILMNEHHLPLSRKFSKQAKQQILNQVRAKM